MNSQVEFARRHVGDSEVKWKKVLWSDEIKIEPFDDQTRRLMVSRFSRSQGDNYKWLVWSVQPV